MPKWSNTTDPKALPGANDEDEFDHYTIGT